MLEFSLLYWSLLLSSGLFFVPAGSTVKSTSVTFSRPSSRASVVPLLWSPAYFKARESWDCAGCALGPTPLIAPQGPGNIGGVVERGRLQVWWININMDWGRKLSILKVISLLRGYRGGNATGHWVEGHTRVTGSWKQAQTSRTTLRSRWERQRRKHRRGPPHDTALYTCTPLRRQPIKQRWIYYSQPGD